jgi:UDP-4-amino-4,6-dideoxy-N-acetyl-beta-L-altrosamine transaminase
MIPYGKQDVSQGDIDAVINVLKSDFLTQGPKVPKFEDSVAKYCNAKHAIAVNSATSALHLACLSVGLGKDDLLWTSPITFVASANCSLYCGAKIDFVDIDPDTFNLCPIALKTKLIEAEKLGKLPKVVVPVHLSGQPCDMRAIYELSKKYGFKIIEDASHAIGGRYLNKPIGNCKYSDITVFSFHPVKIITSGEGGMALTNDNKLAKRMSLLRSHGVTREPSEMKNGSDGKWYYEQIELGYNYRMTDIQAALGISQFKKIDTKISRRHKIAERYNKLLSGLPLKLPYQSIDGYSAYHLYIIRLKNKNIHKQFFNALRNKGIGVNLHYIPLYRHPYYNFSARDYNNFPESESYYSEAITIPLYPTMSSHDQDIVVQAIKDSI